MRSRSPGMSQDRAVRGWDTRLGQHLERARIAALLSRANLAKQLGVSEESVRRWEQGRTRPRQEHLARLIVLVSLDAGTFGSSRDSAEDLPALARALHDERSQRGISQATAAATIGVAQATYAGWEVGRAMPGSPSSSALLSREWRLSSSRPLSSKRPTGRRSVA
jgi:DNA-binding transcriptional regulator YiaG